MNTVTVLTRNLCGVQFRPFGPPGAEEPPEKVEPDDVVTPEEALGTALYVGDLYDRARKSDFQARARAWADEIGRERPDLVALQEAVIWSERDPAIGALGRWVSTTGLASTGLLASHVTIDAVDLLQRALTSVGMTYTVANEVTEYDIQTVGFRDWPPRLIDIRLTQRVAILVRGPDLDRPIPYPFAAIRDRRDPLPLPLQVGNKRSGLYKAAQVFPAPIGKVTLPHAWASVDLKTPTTTLRFGATQLEYRRPEVHSLQAEEFLRGPGASDLPAIWAGDFNSDSDQTSTGRPPWTDTAKRIVWDGGYVDAWSQARPNEPGYTCCQAEDLMNATSTLDERIDHVFADSAFTVLTAKLLGSTPGSRTLTGLWPSDHAGVLVTFELPPVPQEIGP